MPPRKRTRSRRSRSKAAADKYDGLLAAVHDEDRARRVTDRALRDAAEQEASHTAPAVRADRDEVVTGLLGQVRDHRRGRALHELDVEGMAQALMLGHDLV